MSPSDRVRHVHAQCYRGKWFVEVRCAPDLSSHGTTIYSGWSLDLMSALTEALERVPEVSTQPVITTPSFDLSDLLA